MFVAVLIGGLIAFKQLNIEAYPDPTPPMVDIVTQSPGLSAEEIERYITIPIETQVAGIKNLTTIRTISLYGLSDVKLQFSFDYTYDEALQQVLEPPVAAAAAAGQRAAADLAAQPDRRNLPLPSRRPAELQRARPQDAAGLGAAAPLPRRARRDRRHRLGRQDQDLRAAGRFQQAGRQRPDAAATAAGGRQFQHQCRRQHRQYRPAIGRGARRRPDPLDRRSRQHHGVAERRQSGAGQGRRDRDRRREAAARHCRPG